MIENLQMVICIGAGYSQLPYIKELKKRGYRVICADRNPQSPGFEIADAHVVSSTFDYQNTPKALLERTEEDIQVNGVIAPCTGGPYHTAQEVRKIFGLPFTPQNKVDMLLDKLLLRQHCNSVNCSDIAVFNEKELTEDCFPLVKKPRFGGMGGQGVEFFLSLESYQKRYASLKTNSDYVHERFIYGREIAIDAIWDGNKIVFLNTGWTLFDTSLDVIVGSTSEEDLKLISLEAEIRLLLQRFCSCSCLGPETLNVDVVLDTDNILHIIEIEFVPADGIPLCRETFGYDLVKNYVSLYLNEKVIVQPERKRNAALLCKTRTGFDLKTEKSADQLQSGIVIKFFPVRSYSIRTKMGNRIVEGYYIISSDCSDKMLRFIQTQLPTFSLTRHNND